MVKKISIHKIDKPDAVKLQFEAVETNYDDNMLGCRKNIRYFYYTFEESIDLLELSSVLSPKISLQKKWFYYGLNCISELCRLAHFSGEEKEAQIDETGSFIIKVEELKELRGVRTSLQLARIARNKEKEKMIANVRSELLDLDRAVNFGHEYINNLTKLEIEYSLTGGFNNHLFDELVRIYENNSNSIQSKVDRWTNHSLYYIHPYVKAFKSLANNNEVEFNQDLILAIEAHKEVWSQKKALNRGGTPLCRENEGFLSWGCTALAAMAYDKGWKLEVESDYLPSHMVNATINQ